MNQPYPIPTPSDPPERARWFADEVHAHRAALRAYVKGAFPAVRDVDDLVQESFLRVWKRQAAQPIKSAKAFLFAIARNLAIDHLRRLQASPIRDVTPLTVSAVIEDTPTGAETAALRQEFLLALEAIDTLPARCREVVILRKLQGLSPSETAARLRISEETVHVQARNGLRQIRAYLRDRGVTCAGLR